MIIGIGVDIIEVARITRAVAKTHFVETVYTQQEQAYCQSRGAQCYQSYAARFAAKEAVGKALGCGVLPGDLLCIEVVKDTQGAAHVELSGTVAQRAAELGVQKIFLSLSHVQQYAVAQVVAEG